MSKPTPEMWDVVLKTYRDVLDQAEDSYLAKAKSECRSPFMILLRDFRC